MIKNKLFIILSILGGIFGFLTAEAAIPLPWEAEDLPQFIVYFFNLSIIIGALAALGVFIYAGARYLFSGGSPAIIGDAKDQIFSAVAGLILLLFSYAILHTIDPHLVLLEIERPERPPPVQRPDPVIPPPPKIYTYQEIPIGVLVRRTLDYHKLTEIKKLTLEVKETSGKLKKLAQELEILTNDKCDCGNSAPNHETCVYRVDRQCPANLKCVGDPCHPYRDKINAKIDKINSKINKLEGYNDQIGLLAKVKHARSELLGRLDQLAVSEEFLASFVCKRYIITEHDSMIWIKEERRERERETEIWLLFPENMPWTKEVPLINRDILNFYCPI